MNPEVPRGIPEAEINPPSPDNTRAKGPERPADKPPKKGWSRREFIRGLGLAAGSLAAEQAIGRWSDRGEQPAAASAKADERAEQADAERERIETFEVELFAQARQVLKERLNTESAEDIAAAQEQLADSCIEAIRKIESLVANVKVNQTQLRPLHEVYNDFLKGGLAGFAMGEVLQHGAEKLPDSAIKERLKTDTDKRSVAATAAGIASAALGPKLTFKDRLLEEDTGEDKEDPDQYFLKYAFGAATLLAQYLRLAEIQGQSSPQQGADAEQGQWLGILDRASATELKFRQAYGFTSPIALYGAAYYLTEKEREFEESHEKATVS